MKYNVIVTRNITESRIIDIDAKDEEEAKELALDRVGRWGQFIGGWELDEGNRAEIYVSDVEKV